MKLAFTILFFVSFKVNAVTYYVSNTGSDAANGTSISTTWATTPKVNSFSFASGDSILFKGGDSWNSQLKPLSSNIYVGSYGTGKAIFTGFRTATGWTDSSGIWYTTLTGSVAYQNTILIDGVLRAKGRYPNTGSQVALTLNYNQIRNATGLPFNVVGAEAVVMNFLWIWDVTKITAATTKGTNDTITFQDPLTYNANFGGISHYFIQNSVQALDLPYEWAYDSLTKKIWVKLDHEPSLQYSVIDTIVSNHNISSVTYDNVTITGANRINFSADSGRNITLKNSNITNSGMNAIGLNKSPQTVIYLNVIEDALNDGIYTRQQSDTCSFTYNSFGRCAKYAGMNLSGNSASVGVFHWGLKTTFSHNNMDSTGYHGFYWFGQNALVEYNWITNTCLNKTDGGAIYSVPGISQTGSVVRYNVVSNGGSAGIYMDNNSSGISIYGNTAFDFAGEAIVLNGGTNITVTNNTAVNSLGTVFKTTNSAALTNVSTTNNIFYSTIRTVPVYYSGVLNGTVTEDSNYVLRSNASDSLFRYGQTNAYYSLAAWQTFSGKDAHTTETFPTGIVSAAQGVLYSNHTMSAAINPLSGSYTDVYGVTYTNSITLQPFTSALLFKKTEAVVPNRLNSNIKLKVRHT